MRVALPCICLSLCALFSPGGCGASPTDLAGTAGQGLHRKRSLQVESDEKPTVVVIATGGTIAGGGSGATDQFYTSGVATVDALIAAVPQALELVNVEGVQATQLGSQWINDTSMLIIYEAVKAAVDRENVTGVVITHGTDTLEETAYTLNLAVNTRKPIVVVGSMRSPTQLGADGELNFYNAIAVASSPEAVGRGVLVVLNDQIHSGREATKSNTVTAQTFESPMNSFIGTVFFGNIHFFHDAGSSVYKHTNASDLAGVLDGKTADELPLVVILYAHQNVKGFLVDAAVENGAKGIVVAGVGNGNMSKEMEAALLEASKAGVVIVRATRTGSGAVNRPGEDAIDETLDSVAAETLSMPQDARILLKLALILTDDREQIQEWFNEY
ncbi:unnamed protein product [Vitrella brassicaformis CCMP3155]|uniref:asparaginase n=1 Tax=Vitrella brassicaformis (strain CCMP3155) TaxID=1169540 RepID=A0A0G4GD60_VITBC|nr:unnamed protein product [Vitrella brassicaformis CCMP3155]|eukprot:CEM27198.1 unnamed protein product [Vitrella brassicaformis CCMP3155]